MKTKPKGRIPTSYCQTCVDRLAQVQQLDDRLRRATEELGQVRAGSETMRLRVHQLERQDDSAAKLMAEALVRRACAIAGDMFGGALRKMADGK